LGNRTCPSSVTSLTAIDPAFRVSLELIYRVSLELIFLGRLGSDCRPGGRGDADDEDGEGSEDDSEAHVDVGGVNKGMSRAER
jgi:hypothetical protein